MATKLNIEVYPAASEEAAIDFTGVDYLSFINGATYGKPPIIAPETDNYSPGETVVVFVNPDRCAAIRVEKVNA